MTDGSAGGKSALLARGLIKQYGRRSMALHGVDMQIPFGSVTGRVGPNGAGKSTLLKIWAGFERATAGTALVAGMDPWRERPKTLGLIGYVSQKRPLYRDLSVSDHLALARQLRPTFSTDTASHWLRNLGIPLDQRASTLSGGQASQTTLAIAFGTRAPILLLDEPVADLDPLAREDYLAALRLANETHGTTIVLSSHVVSDIERVCDRLLVVGSGSVVLDESVKSAISRHVVLPADDAHDRSLHEVGPVVRGAERLTMFSSPGELAMPHAAPTVEEIVLAYLRGMRTGPK